MSVVKKESAPSAEIRRRLFEVLSCCVTTNYYVLRAVDTAMYNAEAWNTRFLIDDQVNVDLHKT